MSLEVSGWDLKCSVHVDTASADAELILRKYDTARERDHRALCSVRLVSKEQYGSLNDP